MNKEIPQLMDSEGITKALMISMTTYKRWISNNHPLKKYLLKIGGRWFITKDDLVTYVEDQKGKFFHE